MRPNLTPADVMMLNHHMGTRIQQVLPKITGGVCAGLTAQITDIFATQEASDMEAAKFARIMLAKGQAAPPQAPDLSLELMHGLTATALSSLVVSVLAHLESSHLLPAIVQQLSDPDGGCLVLCSFNARGPVCTPIMGHVDAPLTQKVTGGLVQ
jgi:hypothetical protein